jgi:hypothetical protein
VLFSVPAKVAGLRRISGSNRVDRQLNQSNSAATFKIVSIKDIPAVPGFIS